MAFNRYQRAIVLVVFTSLILFLARYYYSSTSILWPAQPIQPNGNAKSLQFVSGVSKPMNESYTQTLVMAKTMFDNNDWIYSELSGLNYSIYEVDKDDANLKVPQNKGHEAMAYLTYMIDNYDNLPDVSLFFHPHRYTWHNNILLEQDSAKTLQRLSPGNVVRRGYFSSRCHHDPGCPDWIHIDRPEAEWDLIKKKEEPWMTSQVWRQLHPNDTMAKVLAGPCCAQFALSRDRIRVRPREEYMHYRQWLIDTPIEDEFSGRIMEYNWHYIFTGETEFCPPQHECYCDGYGICFGGNTEAGLDNWLNILHEREVWDKKLEEWRQNPDEHRDEINHAEAEANELNRQLNQLKDEAYERGKDPAARAFENNRPYKEGDGF